MCRRYVVEGALISEIASELGVSDTSVNNALVGHGIELRPAFGSPPVRFPELRDPEFMVGHLVRQSMSMSMLARELGCGEKTVRVATKRSPVAEALADAGWDRRYVPPPLFRTCACGDLLFRGERCWRTDLAALGLTGAGPCPGG